MESFKKIVSPFVVALAFVFSLPQHSQAQDTSTVAKDTTVTPKDTTVTPMDTTVAAHDTTAASTQTTQSPPPEKTSEKSTLIAYAGPNVSTLSGEDLEKDSKTGFHIGLSWRKKGLIYTQLGIRYNSPVYSVFPKTDSASGVGDHEFSVSDIDLPIDVGINILSGRIVSLRGFLGVIPAFNVSVGDNDEGIDKDKINTFIFYGQAGLGVDVLFLAIDIGYNTGFSDLFKDYKSKPGQGFVNIGFKF